MRGGVFVGHSVSAMIGVLARGPRARTVRSPGADRPSPGTIDIGYVGGFTRADIDTLLGALDDNYVALSRAMAPVSMGNPDRPGLATELTESFCRAEAIARELRG